MHLETNLISRSKAEHKTPSDVEAEGLLLQPSQSKRHRGYFIGIGSALLLFGFLLVYCVVRGLSPLTLSYRLLWREPIAREWGGWHSTEFLVGNQARFYLHVSKEEADLIRDSKHVNMFFWVVVQTEFDRFTAHVSQDPVDPKLILAEFNCEYPGDYTLLAHRLDVRARTSRFLFETSISVLDPGISTIIAPTHQHNKRRCNELELAFPHGRWLTPKGVSTGLVDRSSTVLRSGWTYDMENCQVPQVELSTSQRWILILGSSTDRGIFLSLVDQMLAADQKEDFHLAEVQKCWGHYDVTINNVRFTYQDFRLEEPLGSADNLAESIVCHNDKIENSGLHLTTRNASAFLKKYVFKENATRLPDVIYSNPMFMWRKSVQEKSSTTRNISTLGKTMADHLIPLSNILPKSWNGKWVISAYEGTLRRPPSFSCEFLEDEIHAFLANDISRQTQKQNFEFILRHAQEQLRRIDTRIQLTTILPIYWAKLDETEGKSFLFASLHHHYICGLPGASTRVCSDVIEYFSRILLHVAMSTPEQKFDGVDTIDGNSRSIRLCSDCPASLLPVHILPEPQLSCIETDKLPEDTVEHKVWPHTGSKPCPKSCLDTIVPTKVATQSGSVDVRVCNATDAS